MNTIKTIIPFIRKDGCDIGQLAMVEFEHTLTHPDEAGRSAIKAVLGALERALSSWMERTAEGRAEWEASSNDFNIGDLLSIPEDAVKRALDGSGIIGFRELFRLAGGEEVSYDRLLACPDSEAYPDSEASSSPCVVALPFTPAVLRILAKAASAARTWHGLLAVLTTAELRSLDRALAALEGHEFAAHTVTELNGSQLETRLFASRSDALHFAYERAVEALVDPDDADAAGEKASVRMRLENRGRVMEEGYSVIVKTY